MCSGMGLRQRVPQCLVTSASRSGCGALLIALHRWQLNLRVFIHLAMIPRLQWEFLIMRADLRPYWVKKAWLNCREAWIDYFLRPRCASLGACPNIMNPVVGRYCG